MPFRCTLWVWLGLGTSERHRSHHLSPVFRWLPSPPREGNGPLTQTPRTLGRTGRARGCSRRPEGGPEATLSSLKDLLPQPPAPDLRGITLALPPSPQKPLT